MSLDPKWLAFDLTAEQAKGAVIVGWRAVLVAHVLWACGWLSVTGLGGGFAYAGDVAKVSSDLASLKVELIEQQIWDMRIKQCDLTREGQDSTEHRRRLTQLLTKYQTLTGQQYPLLECRE